MSHFDPNAAASSNSGIFGLPHNETEAALVYIPVPWEVTTSYGGGTSSGPSSILKASHQVDLYDLEVLRPYEAGLYMLPESNEVVHWNKTAKILAEQIIDVGGVTEGSALRPDLEVVNKRGKQLNHYVHLETRRLLASGKTVGIVGGDHSTPFGALTAIAEKHASFGILHFDAHSDTRKAYEGFEWSHASIMYNVLERIPQVTQLTQVGIRDVCEEEILYTASKPKRVKTFFDSTLAKRKFSGENWKSISEEIVSTLPKEVWISFDIDGLDPRFCPHTGTPVPGGLDFSEANHIVSTLVRSGRKIIGFDLNEVSPNTLNEQDEWDANVGARLLYKLSAWTLASQGLAELL